MKKPNEMSDKTKHKNLGGRPQIKIDPVELKKMGQLHFTYEEVAAMVGCSERTIITRFQKEPLLLESYESGRASGKASLRRLQWRHANGTGSSAVNMTIHLSKHWLGESEKSLLEHSGAIKVTNTPDENERNIASKLAGIAAALGANTVPEKSNAE